MGSTLIFHFLYINVLNYCYFHTDCSMFLNRKKGWKNKKTLKRVFIKKQNKKAQLMQWLRATAVRA